MKYTTTTVQKVMLTEVTGLDPIAVYLEDQGPSQGKIIITCFDDSWTSYWGAMGKRTIAQFFSSCDNSYLAKNLSKMPSEVNDLDKLIADMKKEVCTRRRSHDFTYKMAREHFDNIDGEDPEEIINNQDLLYDVYGDEWWHAIPSKPNPDYVHLCRIIDTVKEGLALIKEDSNGLVQQAVC